MRVFKAAQAIAIFPVFIGGCGQVSEQPAQAVQSEIDSVRDMDLRVREAVTSKLRDPDSVNFRNVRKVPMFGDKEADQGPFVYCGEVNAKNAFGGYVGFVDFAVMPLGENGQTSTGNDPVSIMDENDPASAIAYMSFCQDEKGNDQEGQSVQF